MKIKSVVQCLDKTYFYSQVAPVILTRNDEECYIGKISDIVSPTCVNAFTNLNKLKSDEIKSVVEVFKTRKDLIKLTLQALYARYCCGVKLTSMRDLIVCENKSCKSVCNINLKPIEIEQKGSTAMELLFAGQKFGPNKTLHPIFTKYINKIKRIPKDKYAHLTQQLKELSLPYSKIIRRVQKFEKFF